MAFVLTRAAEADLANIWDYTANTWGVDQAKLYTHKIKDACGALSMGVQTGQSAEHIRPGYRKMSIGRHKLYFTVSEEQILVVRILHQSMDVDAHLK